jgi:hypothetical protein
MAPQLASLENSRGRQRESAGRTPALLEREPLLAGHILGR